MGTSVKVNGYSLESYGGGDDVQNPRNHENRQMLLCDATMNEYIVEKEIRSDQEPIAR